MNEFFAESEKNLLLFFVLIYYCTHSKFISLVIWHVQTTKSFLFMSKSNVGYIYQNLWSCYFRVCEVSHLFIHSLFYSAHPSQERNSSGLKMPVGYLCYCVVRAFVRSQKPGLSFSIQQKKFNKRICLFATGLFGNYFWLAINNM